MKRIVLFLTVLSLTGCGASLQDIQAKALPILTQAQAIALQVQDVLAYADEHGVDADSIKSAAKLLADGRPGEAVDILYKGLEFAASKGADIDPTKLAAVKLIRDLMAVQSLQDGLRAVRPESFNVPPVTSPKPVADPKRMASAQTL